MTRTEAIDLLDNLIGMVNDNHDNDYDTALQMGIKALEQEPTCDTCEYNTAAFNPCNACDNKSEYKRKEIKV